ASVVFELIKVIPEAYLAIHYSMATLYRIINSCNVHDRTAVCCALVPVCRRQLSTCSSDQIASWVEICSIHDNVSVVYAILAHVPTAKIDMSIVSLVSVHSQGKLMQAILGNIVDYPVSEEVKRPDIP